MVGMVVAAVFVGVCIAAGINSHLVSIAARLRRFGHSGR